MILALINFNSTTMSTKKLVLGSIAVVLIAGAAYLYSNRDDLMGAFIKPAGLTVSLSSSPVSNDISIYAVDEVLLGFTLKCSRISDCTVSSMQLQGWLDDDGDGSRLVKSSSATTHGTSLFDYITDIKVIDIDSGATYMGPASVRSDFKVTLNDEFTLNAGETRTFHITGDVSTDTSYADGNGENIAFSLLGSNITAENTDGASIVVSGQANQTKLVVMTIVQDVLEVSLASSPVSDTVVRGTSAVPFVGINFTCNSSSDCRLTSFVADSYLDDDGDLSDMVTSSSATTHGTDTNEYVTSVYLTDSSGAIVSDSEPVASSFEVTFDNLDLVIPAGETIKYDITGDISMTAYANSDAENIAFGIDDTTEVTAEDEDGNVMYVTGTANTEPIVIVTTSR